MNKIFDNLYLYEIVLLFLGVFLFMLLCAGLVYFIIKKDDLKKLLLFFPIPIIMIAYPSIQEIQIEKDKFALKKFSDKIIENPNDTEAQKELAEISNKLEKRATSAKDIQAVSFANLLLGNSEKVIDLANKAIEKQEENKKQETPTVDNSSVDSDNSKIEEGQLTDVKVLKNIKELAETQKNLQNNKGTITDTAKLKEQISKIPWQNPKTKSYLSKKILKQHKTVDTIKSR